MANPKRDLAVDLEQTQNLANTLCLGDLMRIIFGPQVSTYSNIDKTKRRFTEHTTGLLVPVE